jgi:hypothetical protein
VILDSTALEEIRRSWQGVESLRGQLLRSAFASVGPVPGVFPRTLLDAAQNLPFVHAASVLNDVLKQLKAEGTIACDGQTLGKLVDAARTVLPWQDLPLIWECVEKRTGVAHYGKLVPGPDCAKYVGAIKRGLVAWGILS